MAQPQGALDLYRQVNVDFAEEQRQADPEAVKPFIPAAQFEGGKPGYEFKKGASGLGYYLAAGAAAQAGAEPAAHEEVAEPSRIDGQQLLEEAEQMAEDLRDLESIDDRGIKRVVAGLERRIRRNQELRLKHADAPTRFLQSEVDLHEVLRKLIALAGEPELYRQLVEQGCLPPLLELLQHGNMDIVAAVADLLQDLTDDTAVSELDEARTPGSSFHCVALV